jgi:hypothetical protein
MINKIMIVSRKGKLGSARIRKGVSNHGTVDTRSSLQGVKMVHHLKSLRGLG